MRKKITFIVAAIIIVQFASCKKTCHEIDKDLLPWIQFASQDSLVYISQYNDTLIFNEFNFQQSTEYEMSYKADEPCHSFALFRADHYSSYDYVELGIEKIERKIKIKICIDFNIVHPEITYLHGEIHRYFKNINSAAQQININGVIYEDALVLDSEADYPSFYCRFNKFIIVKNHGLMQFYDITGRVWTLAE